MSFDNGNNCAYIQRHYLQSDVGRNGDTADGVNALTRALAADDLEESESMAAASNDEGDDDEAAANITAAAKKATTASKAVVDEVGTSDICDGDKGEVAAFSELFFNATPRPDYLHRVDAITKIPSTNGGGTDGAEWYKKAFLARTPSELVAAKNAMPTKTAELLGKVPDQNQYPLAAPGAGVTGITSSSPSESWNKTAPASRLFLYSCTGLD